MKNITNINNNQRKGIWEKIPGRHYCSKCGKIIQPQQIIIEKFEILFKKEIIYDRRHEICNQNYYKYCKKVSNKKYTRNR